MAPQRPGDHFDHVKTPNGAVSTRFSPFFMFFAIFLAAGGGRRRRAVAPTPTPLVSTHTQPKSLSCAAGEYPNVFIC